MTMVDAQDHEPVVVEYDPAACASLAAGLQMIRAYWVANWCQVGPDWALAQADELHDVLFSPPSDDELAESRSARAGPDLGATGVALRRALAQPTGAPAPVFRPRAGHG